MSVVSLKFNICYGEEQTTDDDRCFFSIFFIFLSFEITDSVAYLVFFNMEGDDSKLSATSKPIVFFGKFDSETDTGDSVSSLAGMESLSLS